MPDFSKLDLSEIERQAIAAGLEALKKSGESLRNARAAGGQFIDQNMPDAAPRAAKEQAPDFGAVVAATVDRLAALGKPGKREVTSLLQEQSQVAGIAPDNSIGYKSFLQGVVNSLSARFENVDLARVDRAYEDMAKAAPHTDYNKFLEGSISKIISKAERIQQAPPFGKDGITELDWSLEGKRMTEADSDLYGKLSHELPGNQPQGPEIKADAQQKVATETIDWDRLTREQLDRLERHPGIAAYKEGAYEGWCSQSLVPNKTYDEVKIRQAFERFYWHKNRKEEIASLIKSGDIQDAAEFLNNTELKRN